MQWQTRIEQVLQDEQYAAMLALLDVPHTSAAAQQSVCHTSHPSQAAEASVPAWCSLDRAQIEEDMRLAAELAKFQGISETPSQQLQVPALFKQLISCDLRCEICYLPSGYQQHTQHDQQIAHRFAACMDGPSAHPIDLCDIEDQELAEQLSRDQERDAMMARDDQLAHKLDQEERDEAARLQSIFEADALRQENEFLSQQLQVSS